MNILFMGTPDFAAEILRYLAESRHNVAGVISQPDRPKGRGHKLMPTEVKAEAQKYGYTVYQPETLKNNAISDILEDIRPDIAVVAAYGKLLPEYILNFPKYGCINVHASLLPKYRGAAPIQHAIMNGEKETGITIMQMAKGMDTGDILSAKSTPIGAYETAEELFSRLAGIGGELLLETLDNIEAEKITPVKQDDNKATYAGMIDRDMGEIDWSRTSFEIIRLICGLNSWPYAWTTYKGEKVKIISAVKAEGHGVPGTMTGMEKGSGMKVFTGDGAVYIRDVQFPNSKKMNIEDYIRGHNIEIGVILGQ